MLADAVSHWELAVDAGRTRMRSARAIPAVWCTKRATAPWEGFNRAQAAVLECAVLVTRLKMLPPEKIDAELKYLEIAIAKTAGAREEEAWGWLMEKIAAFRADRS